MSATTSRIPALDGWRGIAILLVLVGHIQAALFGRHLLSIDTGQHGVTIFFVLSGFLITSKLLEPNSNLRTFYMRRFFRLMPAAWFYLVFLAVVVPFIGTRILSGKEAISCLLFYRNYFTGFTEATAHYWSLSIEEQFYLIWPCLLFLLGSRKGAWLAAVGAVSCAVYRFFHWSQYDKLWMNFHTEVRVDALLLGCLFAIVLQWQAVRDFLLRWSKLCAVPLLAITAACVVRFHALPPLLENLSVALLIAASALQPRSLLARALSVKWLTWLGVVSYSIHIWQQFFMLLTGPRGLIVACFGLPLMVFLSYYYVEQPCIRLGRALENRQPTNAYAVCPAVDTVI